jgi:hypothetical protein
MLGELNKERYRALELVADHIKVPSRELRLEAIVSDVSDENLRWVCDRLHHYILRLIEEADYDPADDLENLWDLP